MALTYTAIVTLACQIAKVPSWTAQAAQLLQNALDELCTDYDFVAARGTVNFSFNSAQGQNQGPYVLPTDYLRATKGGMFYVISGVPYIMVPFSLTEFYACVEQAGLAAYPENYAVDDSQQAKSANNGAPVMYVWPPAGGSYPFTGVYQRLMPAVANPVTDTTIPWFPNSNYLVTRTAGELMKITNDDRMLQFLGDSTDQGGNPIGALGILKRYLEMQGAKDVVKQVSLDRRYFGKAFAKLPNTKTVGW